MIDPKSRVIIDNYIDEARRLKSPRQDFSWGWQEELDKNLQRDIYRYAMAKSGGKVTNLGWGFSIEFKHK